jgi:hypothetical protein
MVQLAPGKNGEAPVAVRTTPGDEFPAPSARNLGCERAGVPYGAGVPTWSLPPAGIWPSGPEFIPAGRFPPRRLAGERERERQGFGEEETGWLTGESGVFGEEDGSGGEMPLLF